MLRGRLQLSRAPRRGPSAQRRSVGMLRVAGGILVDLPVDVVVVLEHQECVGHANGTERALRKLGIVGSGEHVFVRYAGYRTDGLRTNVRIVICATKRL